MESFNGLFIKAFDIGARIVNEYGDFTEESLLEDYENPIYNQGSIDVVDEKLVSHGEHYVEYELILKVYDRYFMMNYALGGKDLDEVLDTTDFVEVYRKEVTTVTYEK